jgi:hypothetical protein
MMTDCQEVIEICFSVEANHFVSWCMCNMSLVLDVQVLSVEKVGINEEGQASSCRWIGTMKDGHGGLNRGTKRPRTDHGHLALGDVDNKHYMWRWCLTKVKMVVNQVKAGRGRAVTHIEIVEEA